jgi:hypothetical protein
VRWSIDLRYQATGTATGRPFYPAFVVRSRTAPSTVMTDYTTWAEQWATAVAQNHGTRVHRWA